MIGNDENWIQTCMLWAGLKATAPVSTQP